MKNEICNYFISLVGTNPISSLLSALKYCNEDTTIFLVYTNETSNNIGSKVMADSLCKVIKKKISNINILTIQSDKSEIENIDKSFSEIKIKIENDIKNNKKENKSIVLDYTSGTKVMSAIFLNRVIRDKIKGVNNVKISYVDSNTNGQYMIVESDCQEDNDCFSHFDDKDSYKLEELLRKKHVCLNDISEIYGYKLNVIEDSEIKETMLNSKLYIYETISFKAKVNDVEPICNIEKAMVLNGKVYFCENSKKTAFADIKNNIFILMDKVEKIGGSKSGVIFKCNIEKGEKEKILKDIQNTKDLNTGITIEILGNEETLDCYIDTLCKIY